MQDRMSAHGEIAKKLSFPEYYGNNLDALWDMLTTCDEITVTLTGASVMLGSLRGYGCKLLETFFEAEEENPHLRFFILPEGEEA